MDHQDIITFWFEDHDNKDWFGGKAEFDDKIRTKFGELLKAAEAGELFEWRKSPEGRVAEVIMLDQFTRQLHRGSPRAFASDVLALALAQEAVATGDDRKLDDSKRQFLYMPFMHSESLAIHEAGNSLFESLGEFMSSYHIKHTEVLQRFGRYPMRNEALGRKSTQEELDYMAEKAGSMF